ncbi:MAG: ABC transporter permease [Gaiellaceae bacterium]
MPALSRIGRSFTLYARCLAVQIKAVLEYQADFWILMMASVLMNLVGFVFLWTIFTKIPSVNGWSFWEVVVIYALVFVAEGVGSLFFEGTWNLAFLVNRGELDFMLLRPVSPISQVMSCAIGMNGLGNLLLGGTLIGLSLAHLQIHWTAGKIALALLLLVSSVSIKVGLNLATNASAFWFQNPFSVFAFSMHQLGDLARYPITIYALGVQAMITVAIPFAFISFFPAGAVFAKGDWNVGGVELPLRWLGLATPLVAAYCLGMGVYLFRRGLRRYESAGN